MSSGSADAAFTIHCLTPVDFFRDVATNLFGVRRRAGARSHQQSPVNEPAPVLNAPWHSFLAGEWIRISAAMTLMDTNPYAPPKAVVDDAAAPLFKRRRVVVMILLMIVTFGFQFVNVPSGLSFHAHTCSV